MKGTGLFCWNSFSLLAWKSTKRISRTLKNRLPPDSEKSFALFCFALLCLALLCFVLLCFVLLCFALLCFALLCFALFCFVLLCFALFCFVLLCFVLLCFALFCFALFCSVLFCFVYQSYTRSGLSRNLPASLYDIEYETDSQPKCPQSTATTHLPGSNGVRRLGEGPLVDATHLERVCPQLDHVIEERPESGHGIRRREQERVAELQKQFQVVCKCPLRKEFRQILLSVVFFAGTVNRVTLSQLPSPGQTVLPTSTNSSQVTTSMELGIVWPPTWLELASMWSSSNLTTVWPPDPTQAQLSPSCFVIVRWQRGRSQTVYWFLASWLDLAVPFGHPTMQVLTLKLGLGWLELGVPFGQGLNPGWNVFGKANESAADLLSRTFVVMCFAVTWWRTVWPRWYFGYITELASYSVSLGAFAGMFRCRNEFPILLHKAIFSATCNATSSSPEDWALVLWPFHV